VCVCVLSASSYLSTLDPIITQPRLEAFVLVHLSIAATTTTRMQLLLLLLLLLLVIHDNVWLVRIFVAAEFIVATVFAVDDVAAATIGTAAEIGMMMLRLMLLR
jgi:hypothetical protein